MRFNFLLFAWAAVAAAMTGLSQPITFTKITSGPVVTDLGQFTGCAWCDFNNDGFLDPFVCRYGGTNLFYQNKGGGTFTRIFQGDPFQDTESHYCAAAADYDNDGNLDLVVSAGGNDSTARPNMLYHNNGDGTFSRVSGGSVTNQLGFFASCNWADYDNDGFVDLFVTNGGDSNGSSGKNLLFHNSGDGTFTKVTTGAVAGYFGIASCALWADYDNDGFMDLVVIGPNAIHNSLYHNNRNGTFTQVFTNAVATDSWPSGAEHGAWGDYDNDGLLDLFVTDGGGARNRLYHNNGNGAFTNVTSGPMLFPKVPAGGWANGAAWGDYDNDGYLDLIVTFADATNALYHNNGDGTFTQILTDDPVNDGGPQIASDTCAWVDYDNDGFLDLSITRHRLDGTPTSNLTTNLLYHNNGNTNGWLKVNLVGTVSNRSAIGAKVRVRATIAGKTFWQMREINTGGGWNVVPLVAHFGLGDATNVDTVRIEWPSSTIQEFHNVAPKLVLNITEPPRLLPTATNGIPQFSLKGGRGFQYQIQASADLAAWTSIGTITITNLNGNAPIVDTNAPVSPHRFYRAVSH